MEKVAPSRSPMTVYGRPDNALADDEAPARVPPCLFHPFLSVCSPPFLSLSFFFHSAFLLSFSALSPSSLLPVSRPFSRFVSFLSRATSPSVTMELCVLQPFPLLSPEWTHPLTLSTAENKRVFVSMSLYHSSSLLPPSHTCWIDKSTATHTYTHTHTGEKNCGQVLFMTGKGNIEIVSE